MAKENPSWGYDRIVGALANLGYRLSDQTVGKLLRRHGLPPAPKRKQTVSWIVAAASLAAIYRTLSRGAQPSGQRQSHLVSFADGGKKGRGSSAVSRTTGRPAEVLPEASGIKAMGQRAMGSQ